MIIVSLWQRQLGEDAVYVLLDCALRDPQLGGDACIGTPLCHQSKNLPLPRAENGQRVVPSARRDKFVHQGRVDHGAAPGDPIQRLCEFFDVGHTTLEQVSDPVTAGQQLHHVLDLDVRGELQDRDVRKLLPDRARRLQPLLGVRLRHPDVYDDQIRGVRSYEVKEFLGVAGLTGHGKAGALEKARQARTQKHIVVRDDDPHPAPGGALSALSHVIYPHARPSANIAVGRMRWGGHMSHSSGGKPPCAAA